jgi:hypothetical protein
MGMDMFRVGFAFLAGVVIMGAVHFTGWLDRLPHWWDHHSVLNAGTLGDDTSEHARYTVRAIYQPSQSSDGDCAPQYEFHNRTNRQVVFSTKEDDSPANFGPSNSGPSNSGPPQGGAPQNYGAQNYGAQNDDDDDDDHPSSRGGNSGDNQYYDEYPGGSDSSSPQCNSGVVQIFVDWKK